MVPVAVAAAAVAVGAVIGFSPATSSLAPRIVTSAAGADPAPSTVSGTWRDEVAHHAPTSYEVADAAGPVVHLYSAPDQPLAARPTMDNPTWEGLPVVFLVLDRKGPWLHVRVSMRPNGFTAWVASDEVIVRKVPNRVIVEVGARRVTVTHGDKVLLQGPVGVGTADAPTPLGNFFVDGIVKVPNPNGPYGAYQVSVSGFSGVYETFGGGVGQIALHGTNQPELIGQPVSHGCVRMTNDLITVLAQLAPTGTPVDIIA
jgi:lipoprotein-anchoring transpeptidase ErfK/SrfK